METRKKKEDKIKLLDIKTVVSEMNNVLCGTKDRLDIAEGNISGT